MRGNNKLPGVTARGHISKSAEDMIEEIETLDGLEVHESELTNQVFKELRNHDLINVSGGRGPGGAFHRVTVRS